MELGVRGLSEMRGGRELESVTEQSEDPVTVPAVPLTVVGVASMVEGWGEEGGEGSSPSASMSSPPSSGGDSCSSGSS